MEWVGDGVGEIRELQAEILISLCCDIISL
jgi:hypothetical protein